MSKLNFGALITVSLKSKRLKNKAILNLGEQTIIENIIDRMSKICEKENIILITSNRKIDIPLHKIAKVKKINFFAGDAKDVLERMSKAANKFKLQNFNMTMNEFKVIF